MNGAGFEIELKIIFVLGEFEDASTAFNFDDFNFDPNSNLNVERKTSNFQCKKIRSD